MHSRRCAMSLIEVTLVIFVIGVLAAVAAPRFSQSLRVMKLESAARQLAAHINYVRRVAINESRTTELVCDNSLHTYRSISVDSPERTGEPLQVSMPRDFDPTITLTANFDAGTTLLFDFEGVPHVGVSPLSQGTIEIGSGDERFVVTIAPGTAATSVARISDGGSGGSSGGENQDAGPESVDGQSGATP